MKKKEFLKNGQFSSYRQASARVIQAQRVAAFFISVLFLTAVLAVASPGVFSEETVPTSAAVMVSSGIVPPEPDTERKTVSGKIGAKNFNGVAFVYEENGTFSKEMWMPYHDGLYLEGYNNLESITEGDQVQITYDESLETPGQTKLRAIKLIEQAPEEVPEPEEEPAA